MDFEMLHIIKIKFSAICNKKNAILKFNKILQLKIKRKIRMNSRSMSPEVGWYEEATDSDLNKKQWHFKLCYSNLSMNKKNR